MPRARAVAWVYVTVLVVSALAAIRWVGSAEPVVSRAAVAATVSLVPGRSAGAVELGMSLSECERVLGPPTLSEALEDGPLVSWNPLGLSVQLARPSHPMGAPEADPAASTVVSILVNSDRYRTDSGLAVGVGTVQVEGVFGPAEHHTDMLTYPHRGITFLLTDGKVQSIVVFQRSKE